MARKPRKVKAGTGMIRVNVLIDADQLVRVDEEASRMTAEDAYKRVTTRSDAIRSLVDDGLKYRADRRGK